MAFVLNAQVGLHAEYMGSSLSSSRLFFWEEVHEVVDCRFSDFVNFSVVLRTTAV